MARASLALLLALLGALAQAPPPASAAATATSADDVTVSTEAGLLAALGTPSVLIIRMAASISMRADSVILGASPSTGVYLLTRNLTLTTPPDTAWYPTLDLTAVV